jgi:hypothetical protein
MSITTKDIATTTYTLLVGDDGLLLRFTSNAAVTVTCPDTLLQGFQCQFAQIGDGQVTFIKDGTTEFVDLRVPATRTKGSYGAITLDDDALYKFNGEFASSSFLPFSNVNATVAPTTLNNATEGYTAGSRWVDQLSGKVYDCVFSNAVTATWNEIGAGAGDMEKATYDPSSIEADAFNQDNMVEGTTNKNYTVSEQSKLSGIEAGATADQDGAEIKALYAAEVKAFTDALYDKLDAIEASATADQTGAEIKAAYELEVNAFTDALFTKLNGIETGATGDQTNSEIETAYNAQVSLVSQAEAEAGVSTTRRGWNALRVKQAVEALAAGSYPPSANTAYTVNTTIGSGDIGKRITLGSGATTDVTFTLDVSLLANNEDFITFFNNDPDFRLEIVVSNTSTMNIGSRTNLYLWHGQSVTLTRFNSTRAVIQARG